MFEHPCAKTTLLKRQRQATFSPAAGEIGNALAAIIATSSSICSAQNAENGSSPGAVPATGAATAFIRRKLCRFRELTPGQWTVPSTRPCAEWRGEVEEETEVPRVDFEATTARAVTCTAIGLRTVDMLSLLGGGTRGERGARGCVLLKCCLESWTSASRPSRLIYFSYMDMV